MRLDEVRAVKEKAKQIMSTEQHMNQFGQILQRGTLVGHANRTGSYTSRKVGVVTGFTTRRDWNDREHVSVKVSWIVDPTAGAVRSPGVGVNKLFVLDSRNIDQDIVHAAIDAL